MSRQVIGEEGIRRWSAWPDLGPPLRPWGADDDDDGLGGR